LPKIKVNDINIYYEIHGDGPPLLMITGLSANIYWYNDEYIEEFAKHYKLIILDNRGTGRTDTTDKEFSIKMLAEDAVGLMDALKIDKFFLMGTSMGGMISQELVLNFPERVEKIVLCSTSCGMRKGIPPPPQVLQLMKTKREGMKPEFIAKASLPILYTKEFIKNNREFIKSFIQQLIKAPITPEMFDRQIIAISKFNSFKRLKTITTPTLIIHGKEDILLPPQNSEIIAKEIPNAKLVLFDDAAHIVFQPEPERVFNTIFEFLNS